MEDCLHFPLGARQYNLHRINIQEVAEDTQLHSDHLLWDLLAQHIGYQYKVKDDNNNQVY